MSDWQETPGHWQASDGKWYPPETHPDYRPTFVAPEPEPVLPQPTPVGPPPGGPSTNGTPWWRAPWLFLGGLVAIAAVVAFAVFSGGDDDSIAEPARDTVEPSTPDSDPPDNSTADDDPPDSSTPDSDPDASDEPTAAPSESVTPDAAVPDATAVEDSPPDPTAAPAPAAAGASTDPSCTYLGTDAFDDMQVELAFTSETTSPIDLMVTYGLFDSDGTRFTTSTEQIESAAPGEPFRIHSDTLQDLPTSLTRDSGITCEILETEEFDFGSDPVRPQDDDSCTVLGVDSFGDIQVEIAVTNASSSTIDLFLTYALRADGIRFGESFASFDLVDAGQQIQQEDDSLTDIPEWASGAELTCELLSIDTF